MTPSWIFGILAAVMLAVAVVSAARLALVGLAPARLAPARRGRRAPAVTWSSASVDIAHLLMAIAMAGMLTQDLRTLSDPAWEVIFALMTAWFAYRVLRDALASGVRALAGGRCASHLVHSAAMLYMYLATTPIPGMGGMAGMPGMNELPASSGSTMLTLDHPTLALAFTLILIAYGVGDLDRLSGRQYRLAGIAAAGGAAGIAGAGVTAIARPRAADDAVALGSGVALGVGMAVLLLIAI